MLYYYFNSNSYDSAKDRASFLLKLCKKLVIDNNGELIYVEKDSIQCTVCGECN